MNSLAKPRCDSAFLFRSAARVAALIALAVSVATGWADTADDQYEFAAGLYQQKLYEEAANQLTKFIVDNPKHPKVPYATFFCAQSQQSLKQYDKAVESYERVATRFPSFEFVAQARLQQGECYWNLSQFDKARLAFQGAAKSTDEKIKSQALYWVGECYYAQEDFANAMKFYQQVTAFPQSEFAPYAYYSLGLCQLKSNNPSAAGQSFQKVLTGYPQSEVAAESHFRFAEALREQKKFAEAQREYQDIVNDSADARFAASAWVGLGYCNFELKDYAAAATAFEKALAKLQPDNDQYSEALLRAGDCYYNRKQFDRAVDFYGRVVRASKSPVRDQALYWMGNARREEHNPEDALKSYRELIRSYPQSPLVARAYLRIGDALTDEKNYAGAVEAYRKVQSLQPPSDVLKEAEEGMNQAVSLQTSAGGPEAEKVAEQLKGETAARAWVQLGNSAFQRKDYAKAVDFFGKALSNSPKGSDWEERALYSLAAAQVQSKDLTHALTNYRKQLSAFPYGKLVANARVDLAWALLTNDQPDQVEAILQPLLTDRPADKALLISALSAGAEAAVRLKKFDRAASLYEELATKYADTPDLKINARLGLASTLMEQSKYAQAATAFKDLVDLNPPADIASLAWLRYGVALIRLEKKDEALAAFTKVVTDFPKEEADALFHVGDYYFDKKNFGKAADAYRSLTTRHPAFELTDKALYRLGAALFYQEDYAGAAQALQQAVTKFPKSSVTGESQYWLGEALEHASKLDEAKAAYTAFTEKFPTEALIPRARLGLGRVYLAQKNFAAAKDSLEKIDPKSDRLILAEMTKLAGDLFFGQKEYKGALENYLKVTIVYTESPFVAESLFRIGECQDQLGNKDKAKEAYQKVIDQFADSPFAAKAKQRMQS